MQINKEVLFANKYKNNFFKWIKNKYCKGLKNHFWRANKSEIASDNKLKEKKMLTQNFIEGNRKGILFVKSL